LKYHILEGTKTSVIQYVAFRFNSSYVSRKHYESLNDLIDNLTRNFKSPNRKEQFITTFSELLNNYLPSH